MVKVLASCPVGSGSIPGHVKPKDKKNGTLAATSLSSCIHYGASAKTGRPGVSIHNTVTGWDI